MTFPYLYSLYMGIIVFLFGLPVNYFMFREIRWKYTLVMAISMAIGTFIGILLFE
ncbi:hypothetical protein [Methanococcoides methylutens]|uniref:hypothetical protein n=1 Tax=Methanococcoides methylutens TaxID=2226 RepID=UPI0012E01BDD|nr:hypothetical protein [Methanococcoides methylutens]